MIQAMAKFQVIYIYVIFLAWEFLANFFCAKIYIQMEKITNRILWFWFFFVINFSQKVVCLFALFVASVQAEAEAEADAEAAYGGGHHGNRGLLVQPIPEADPICHLEYEVVTKTHCEVEHR